mmetsp:Transcript_68226/g.113417  ORF Transcript_68226/g.113417 Transcript_68226/m.113417 type:complete len:121 (+) Transcript_68226:131-493(+)
MKCREKRPGSMAKCTTPLRSYTLRDELHTKSKTYTDTFRWWVSNCKTRRGLNHKHQLEGIADSIAGAQPKCIAMSHLSTLPIAKFNGRCPKPLKADAIVRADDNRCAARSWAELHLQMPP